MNHTTRRKLPRIGMRIIKSAVAVFISFAAADLANSDGVLFYAHAALWCIQPQRENMRMNAVHRMIGTFIGAVFGLAVILTDQKLALSGMWGEFFYIGMVSAAVIPVIYITLLIRKRDTSYFSCVTFLSIVVTHIGEADPYPFVWRRLMDTLIGIVIGMAVNSIRLPYRKVKDTLFVLCMDDEILSENRALSSYGYVELNRMLDDGANFTMSTRRTPASLIEMLRGIELKLPVIAMDGAVMYDLKKHEYLHAYVLSQKTVCFLQEFLDAYDVNYFLNMLLDNVLIIQHKNQFNEAEQGEYERRRYSPYAHFTTNDRVAHARCVYVMLLQKEDLIQEIHDRLLEQEFCTKLRVAVCGSCEYPGYVYLNIYNRNATKENMIEYLKQETGLAHTLTFGSTEGTYDITIKNYSRNKGVHTLKKMYEPLRWKHGPKQCR